MCHSGEKITELCLFSELVTELCLLAPKRTELCLCVLFARSCVSELSAVTELCLFSFLARSCVSLASANVVSELCLFFFFSRGCVFFFFLHGVVSSSFFCTELCLLASVMLRNQGCFWVLLGAFPKKHPLPICRTMVEHTITLRLWPGTDPTLNPQNASRLRARGSLRATTNRSQV